MDICAGHGDGAGRGRTAHLPGEKTIDILRILWYNMPNKQGICVAGMGENFQKNLAGNTDGCAIFRGRGID